MEKEIELEQEAIVVYSGGGAVSSVNGYTGDVVLTTSDLENTSDYQTGAQVQNAIAGKQDKLTAGSGLNLDGTILSVDTNIIATVQDVTDEATIRENSDANLQGQIDALTVSSGVIDVLGTYQDLQNYDTTHVKEDDIIKVLQDSTHSNAMSYYKWVITSNVGAWVYVGSEGPFYTKSEADVLLNSKQDEITSSNKLLSDLVDDTNQTNKFVTTSEKQTWNNKYDKPNSGIPKTDLASAVQTSLGKADTALQSISSSDVTSALGYTPYNSTNPNGYTSNVGTITGITMNGASKGTSGVVDLGTVITSHQDISGKANKISVVQTSASTIEINSNTFYKFGEVASLTITLASITDNTIYNEYMFEFVSGTTATTLTLPSSIKWLETPTIDANKIYQCSIVDNIGILVGVANV